MNRRSAEAVIGLLQLPHDGSIERPTKPLFIVTLWITLATAMLCALWPAGLPATTAIGSAFSPATTAVALRGRAEQVRPPVKRVLKAEPQASHIHLKAAQQQPAISIRLPSLVGAPIAKPGDTVFPIEPAFAPALAPAKAFHARGPPLP